MWENFKIETISKVIERNAIEKYGTSGSRK
jgi:hypothetical protein